MCGRFTYAMTNWPKVWKDFLNLDSPPVLERVWNVAPTRKVPVVRLNQQTGDREFVQLVWGLVPSWAKEMSVGSQMINARGETVATKPAFRAAFRQRRCLMLSTGFYEWQHAGEKRAQPWFIRVKHLDVFAFAAIWESWTPKGQPDARIETCAIITIEANETMKRVHHRMPVILDPEDWARWLDPTNQDPERLQHFLKPCPPEWLTMHQAPLAVNNARNNSPDLIEPKPALPLFGGPLDAA